MSDAYTLTWLILDHQMVGIAAGLWFYAMIVGVLMRSARTML